ncbi:MAG: hypothetical protein IKG99_01980 [Bacteroidaceae bacterium]|nr:hypothetical protein [Bacteroidaceae bacterium]
MKQFKLLLTTAALMLTASISAQTDVTDTYITNAGFDDCTAETSDVAAKTIKDYSSTGWTNATTGAYTTIAVTAYGGGKKVANSTTPSTKKDGTTASGNTLGIIAGWADDVKIQSGDITLPAGSYTLSVDHYLSSSTNNYTNSNFGFVTSSNSYLVSSTTFTASTWTTETVTFTLTEETTGKIQIGLKGNNKTGSGAPAVFYDDVTLTYTDPDAAAHAAELQAAKYTLNGYIKKATALNGVLANTNLTTAIGTAQGVYDSATDYSALSSVNDAATTLQNDIVTALTGAQSIALTNANFDTYNIAVDGTNSASIIEPATNEKPYIYPVDGWTQNFKFNSTASQGNTAAYGATITGNQGNNGTNPPAADMFGSSQGGTLHLSAGWGDYARYYQETTLTQGKYIMYYEAYNANTPTGANGNYFGVSGEAGDFYGTTNSFVFDEDKTFPSGEWKAFAFEFDVAAEKTVNVNVGICSTTGGSATGPKLWIDNVLVYRIGDVTVTEADADAILTDVAELDEAIYNANVKAALANAKATFEADKTLDNYNALSEALIAAQESVTLYEEFDAALTNMEAWSEESGTNVAECYRADYNEGVLDEYDNLSTVGDLYTMYQIDQVIKLAQANATDYTSAIINPGFETGDGIGWEYNNSNDTRITLFENNAYAFEGAQGDFIFNTWGGSTKLYIKQTIPGLPAGTYQLSAVLAGYDGADIVLSANDFTKTLTAEGGESKGYETSLIFTLDEPTDVDIMVTNQANISFFKCDEFKLTVYEEPLADADDYAALNAAIEAAEAKTLGFDAGEYAPYNNIEAIETLAEAKAINQTEVNPKEDITTMTTALQNAVWTANTEEVDAIFDGQFANTAANTQSGVISLPGWSTGVRWLVKDENVDPGLAYTDGKAAIFFYGGTTLTYGEQTGYTLPLNEGEVYELTLKVSAWRDGDFPTWFSVKFNDGEAQIVNPENLGVGEIDQSEVNPFVELKFYLTPTQDTKNLHIFSNKHTAIADLSLKLAVGEDVTINETEDFTPTNTFANVTLNRTIKAGWNTVVLPFELTAEDIVTLGGEGAVAYTISDYADDNLKFATAETVPANTPFFLKATAAGTSFTFYKKFIEEGMPESVFGDGIGSLLGSYAATFDVPVSDEMQTAYILSGGKFYKVDSAVTIKGTRFCILLDGEHNANTLGFTFEDGEANAINGIASETAAPEGIYNLQGQKVEKATKGIYIINGKKTLVK